MNDREAVQKILDDTLCRHGIRSYYRRKPVWDKNADVNYYVTYTRYLNYSTWFSDGSSRARDVGYDISFCYKENGDVGNSDKADSFVNDIVMAFRKEGWTIVNDGIDGGESEGGFWEIISSFKKEHIKNEN